MKTQLFALAGFISVLASFESSAHADGIDLDAQCRSNFKSNRAACESFVNGVVWGIKISPHPIICFPANYDARLSVSLVERFMNVHPEALSSGPAMVVRTALINAYPCDIGKISASVLGVMMTDLTPTYAQNMKINAVGGIIVRRVEPNSSAYKAGMEEGDVITAVDSQSLLSAHQLTDAIAARKPGDKVKLTLWRNGQEKNVTAILQPR